MDDPSNLLRWRTLAKEPIAQKCDAVLQVRDNTLRFALEQACNEIETLERWVRNYRRVVLPKPKEPSVSETIKTAAALTVFALLVAAAMTAGVLTYFRAGDAVAIANQALAANQTTTKDLNEKVLPTIQKELAALKAAQPQAPKK